MAPLLLTALVGVGVKFATDLLMSGVKELMKPSGGATSSFASTLDKARAASAGPSAAAGTKLAALDAGLADRSRVLAADFSAMPAPGRAHGAESYRKLADIVFQAP